MPFDEHGFVWFWHEPVSAVETDALSAANGVVRGVMVEPETQDDGGKQTHCAEPVVIDCKHGQDVVEQFVVKQPSKS